MAARLTERDEFGNACIKDFPTEILYENLDFDQTNKLTEVLNALAHYEDELEKYIQRLKSENEALKVQIASERQQAEFLKK